MVNSQDHAWTKEGIDLEVEDIVLGCADLLPRMLV